MSLSSSQSIFLIKSSEHKGFGTGFVVHTDERGSYLLTNAHVVEECGEETLEVDGKKATLLHMGSSSKVDLALLYVEGLDGVALKLSGALAEKGVLFELSGFRQHLHGNHKLEALKGNIKKLSTLYAGSEKIEKYELNIDKDDAIQRGYSGSPVLCPSSGNVIAIITTRYNETHAEAIPMEYLSSLWSNMPQGLLGSEVCDDRVKKTLPWMQIGVASGVVATVIAGVALFMPSESTQSITIGNGNSNVTITQNKGLTTEALELIVKPYQEKIDELKSKLKSSTSEEEKLKLSALLEKANREKEKKDKEIAKLKELIDNAKYKIVKEVMKVFNNDGIEKALAFLQNSKSKEQEQLLNSNISEWAEKYRLEAQLLVIENRYTEAKEAYKKALKYDRTPDTLFDYALFLQNQNYFSEATTTYEQLLVEQRALAKTNPLVYKPDIGTILNNLANLYSVKNEMTKAEEAYEESLILYKSLAKTNPFVYNAYVAITLNNLANLYGNRNEIQKAEEAYHESLILRRALAKNNPSVYNVDVAGTLNNLANLYKSKNDIEKAEEAYQESLMLYKSLAKTNPSVYNAYVAMILNNLAIFYHDKNKMKKAEEMYKESLILIRALAKNNPSVYNVDVAGTLNNLANLYKSKNDIEKAEEAYQESLILYKSLAKTNPSVYNSYVATILNNLGLLYNTKNEMIKAEEAYQEALRLRRALAKINPSVYEAYVAKTLNNLAAHYYVKKELLKAEEVYQEAQMLYISLAKTNPSVYSVDLAITLNNLAILYNDKNEIQKAEKAYQESLILRRALAKKNPSIYGIIFASSLVMGVNLFHQPIKNLDEAERVLAPFKGRGISKVEWLLGIIEKKRKE